MSVASRSMQGAKTVVHWYKPSTWKARGWLWRIGLIVATLAVIIGLLMFWWSREPGQFDVQETRSAYLAEGQEPVVGSTVTGTTIKIIDTLLGKSGGFLMNDVTPPGFLMDNIPSWEIGVLRQLREVTLSLRTEFSRSQSQSAQVPGLEEADSLLRNDPKKWIFPSPENKYGEARDNLVNYGQAIADEGQSSAQFYARADNLVVYLDLVSKSLGDLTQRLSASVGDVVMDIDQQSEVSESSTQAPLSQNARTPWLQLDNIFYEARGYSWALLHELKAIRVDFAKTLQDKNALASLDQIIAELEKSQKPVWSPMILNGRGFGFSANHSLVMASYLSRANAAIIDLHQLLKNG
ncbi:DUF2333 family protein [Suttonella sp. R2A3]|uniref:DUF2333 family protein n=1 Tax=Suttonella sp. R2A3 TaxID=2908648 RepID=UPI001F213BB8|nr:DUF2333 family protein [Suttonella sp. R2A3]UJF25275.1 DUF2333 family protein [Suttonella sp. R2A3]